jgi:hypothetical protein
MYELRQAGDQNVSPNIVTYNSVISAWGSSKSRLGAERACAYLERLKKLTATGGIKCRPTEITYTNVIHAWSGSGHPDTAWTVRRLREEMSRLKKYDLGNDFQCLASFEVKVIILVLTSTSTGFLANIVLQTRLDWLASKRSTIH